MNVLVINSGSATLKLDFIQIAPDGPTHCIARGRVEGLGSAAKLRFTTSCGSAFERTGEIPDPAAALDLFLGWLRRSSDQPVNISAVGHRFVHGGSKFSAPAVISPGVLSELQSLGSLAPLHNPPALSGIRAARLVLGPDLPMVAVFDTAFHGKLPEAAATYALPLDLSARLGIRRYGFHGLAHHSMLRGYSELAGVCMSEATIITAQLGSGCSLAAIHNGCSVETSMGFTPLEGLMMGTRAGDLDPGVLLALLRNQELSLHELEELLNRKSGLLGVSGRSADMRELLELAHRDYRACLAIEMFCHRAVKYAGAFLSVLGGAQAIVFGGGIGENSPEVRARICGSFEWCGLCLDAESNLSATGRSMCISTPGSIIQAWVICVDESTLIAQETAACCALKRDETQ
jgi:acetate kinase